MLAVHLFSRKTKIILQKLPDSDPEQGNEGDPELVYQYVLVSVRTNFTFIDFTLLSGSIIY